MASLYFRSLQSCTSVLISLFPSLLFSFEFQKLLLDVLNLVFHRFVFLSESSDLFLAAAGGCLPVGGAWELRRGHLGVLVR